MAFAVFAVCVIFALSCSETSGTSLRVEPISLHKGHVPQKDSPGLGDNLYDFCSKLFIVYIYFKVEKVPLIISMVLITFYCSCSRRVYISTSFFSESDLLEK